MATLRAVGLNCTLKAGPAPSSTELLVGQVLDELATHDVTADPSVRVVDLDKTPDKGSDATAMAASNAAHLARLLQSSNRARRPQPAAEAAARP